ncbi:hypothetical protein B296_00015312, partial [Ensete ventricosum]
KSKDGYGRWVWRGHEIGDVVAALPLPCDSSSRRAIRSNPKVSDSLPCDPLLYARVDLRILGVPFFGVHLRRLVEARRMAARCSIAPGGGEGSNRMASSVEVPQSFQSLDGIRTLAESGRFKCIAVSFPFVIRRDDPWFAKLGKSCIHMTWSDRGAISLEVC